MSNLTEKQAILKIKEGYIDFFEFLVKKYSRRVFFLVKSKVFRKEDAQDIVQNSFIKAYKSLDHFDLKKPFAPYLFSIARNEIAQFYRDNPKCVSLVEDIVANEDSGIKPLVLEFLLKGLKPHYQKVLKLYLAGFSYKEISQKIGKPLNTVKTLIRRAKTNAKKIYESK